LAPTIDKIEQAYRRIACAYARAADHGPGEAFAAVFAEGGKVVTPRRVVTKEMMRDVPARLKATYAATRHEVLNQTILSVEGNRVQGETYCCAHHLAFHGEQPNTALVWLLRYRDEMVLDGEELLFLSREIVIDWTETRPANPPGVVYPDPSTIPVDGVPAQQA
jgi:hypothetical protein